MQSDATVVRRFYEAMHRMDAGALLATLSEDFVGHVSAGFPGGFGGTYEGGEHMLRGCWGPVHQQFGAMPHPSSYLVAEPGHVVAIGEYRGTPPATRRPFAAAFAHVFRLTGGRIVELRQITDTQQWATALSDLDVATAVVGAAPPPQS